jgi:CBS domain-containing protein
LETQPIGSIALEPIASVQKGASLADALDEMRNQHAAYVLVFEGETLAGILTERDLLTRVIGPDGLPTGPVTDYMTPNPTCLPANKSVSEALGPMVEGSYRHLPIQDEQGGFVGVLSIHNLFTFLAELMPDQILNLPPRPHQHMPSAEGA